MTGPWLRPSKAAAYVDMPYKSFAAWVKQYGVPFTKIGKRNRRFSQSVLDRVLHTISLRKAS